MEYKHGIRDFFGKNLVNVFVVLGIILSLFFVIKTVNEIKRSSSAGREIGIINTIAVRGKSEILAVPDVASFYFTVTKEAKNVQEAQTKSADAINKAIKYLKDNKIDEKDIKNSSYSVYPKYEYMQPICSPTMCPPSKSILQGYEVSQTITVKVRDIDKAGKILSGIGSVGVQNISGLELTVDDAEKLKLEARELAIKDARENAKKLAKALGVRLGRIQYFNDDNGWPGPIYAEKSMAGMGGGRDSAYLPPEIPKGENKIVSNVTITYEIR